MNILRTRVPALWAYPLLIHTRSLSAPGYYERAGTSVEKLWQQFFYNPSEWWDNRLGKRDPDYPDFKHKYRKEALWLDTGSSFDWVKAKLAAMTQQQAHSDSGLKLLNDYHFGVDLGDHGRDSTGKEIGRPDTSEAKEDMSNRSPKGKLIRYPTPCLFSWNSAISGYAKGGHGEKALELLKEMQRQGVKPDKFTFVSILNACAAVRDLEQGKLAHEEIIRSGVKLNIFVWNALVDMYIKCGSIDDARRVFDRMCQRDVVSWTAMISAYLKTGACETALDLFDRMLQQEVEPDRLTFVSVLNACARLKALSQGRRVHELMTCSSYHLNIYVWNALIDMYGKCGSLEEARQVFDKVSPRDVVTWNTMISAYAKVGRGEEALELFRQMQLEDMKPDKFTYVTILNVCTRLRALEEGKKVHALMIKSDDSVDEVAWDALIHMYTQHGSSKTAREVLDTMRKRV
ncbi:hypothetical protein R1sor_025308 [Riccia sorocarpa]|uniref:Pentatricopeptide repeat-containing protein n=1 Tax=Riccia sorocarpa TaxID=122646 RepID=A0ABD3G892_9MARC